MTNSLSKLVTITATAGTPQGTVSGPSDFKVIINDLTFNTTYAKYVDNTAVLSVSRDVNDSADFYRAAWNADAV